MRKPPVLVLLLLIGATLWSGAAEKSPSLRVSGAWVILSGNWNSPNFGPLPWTYALRRSAILSACIESDYAALHSTDGTPPRNLEGATDEEVAAVAAIIEITTNELGNDGGNKRYRVEGLTHGTAPDFLRKILEAVDGAHGVPLIDE